MGVVTAEGWYVDPFQRHEARWISDGHPTALVKDGDVELNDPPPVEDMHGPLVPFDRPADWDQAALSAHGKLWDALAYVPWTS